MATCLSVTTGVALIIAGCGTAVTTSNQAKVSSDSGQSGQVTIDFMTWASGQELTSLKQAFANFEKLHPNITVKPDVVTNSEYETKLATLVSANSAPDIAYMDYPQMYGEKGQLTDLTNDLNHMKGLNYTSSGTKSAFLPGLIFKDKGHDWGVSIGPEIQMIFYNKSLFKQAGIQPPSADPEHPWTWNQVVAAAQKLTVDVNGKHPGDPGFQPLKIKTYGIELNTGALDPLTLSNGGGTLSRDGKSLLINKPASTEVIQDVANLALGEHLAPPPSAASTMPSGPTMLENGQLAMLIDGQYQVGTFNQDKYMPGYAAMPMFKTPKDMVWSAGISIFKSSKHQKEDWELLEYLLNPKNILNMYKTGVWIPPLLSWYTDPKLAKLWSDNPIHGGNYMQVVKNTVTNPNIAVSPYFIWAKNNDQIENELTQVEGDIWTGKETAAQAMQKATPKLDSLLQGSYQ